MSHTNPSITLSKPIAGWTTLTINNVQVNSISYVNPYLLEDIYDWFVAELNEKDHVCRLDREGKGMAYLISSETQDILLVCDDGTNHTDFFTSSDDVRTTALNFANTIDENFDHWVEWQCPEEEEREEAVANLTNIIYKLKHLNA